MHKSAYTVGLQASQGYMISLWKAGIVLISHSGVERMASRARSSRKEMPTFLYPRVIPTSRVCLCTAQDSPAFCEEA